MNRKALLEILWNGIMNSKIESGEEIIQPHLLDQIAAQIMKDKPDITPYTPIPNVRRFRIEALAPHHPIFLKAGIKKREFKPEMEFDPYWNKRMNNHVKNQFARMKKARNNPALFWRIANWLLHTSVSYQVICINHVLNQWHRKMNYRKVWDVICKMRTMDYNKYPYHITMIPKPNGEERPLGVPNPEWRIYLHGLQNIIMLWLSPLIADQQHGFYKKRG